MSLPISLVMIAKNEEKDIANCINSAKDLVDEIIVVENGSTDKTVEVAKSLGAKVLHREFDTFASQKNYALSLAKNDWVLHLDPDEYLSEELKAEIKKALTENKGNPDGYDIPYKNYFLGKLMRHTGLGSEHHVRLFKKSKSMFGGGLIHEGIRVEGKTLKLRGHIVHNSYPDMEEYLEKFNDYTTLAANKMFAASKKFSIFRVLSVPVEFWKRFLFKLGFLDGFRGLVWSAISAFYVFVKYVKLWKLEQDAKVGNDRE
jgi:glycosyltransferase involved in cell wall biosynthesis